MKRDEDVYLLQIFYGRFGDVSPVLNLLQRLGPVGVRTVCLETGRDAYVTTSLAARRNKIPHLNIVLLFFMKPDSLK